jgi:hypothetical protein
VRLKETGHMQHARHIMDKIDRSWDTLLQNWKGNGEEQQQAAANSSHNTLQ